MIDRLQKADAGFGQRLRLLNADGYWLKAADPAQEWGFDLPERAAFNLGAVGPAALAGDRSAADGTAAQRQQPCSHGSTCVPADFAGTVSGQLLVDDAYLIVGSQVTKAESAADVRRPAQTMLPVAAGLVAARTG